MPSEIRRISDAIQDPKNLNLGSDKGAELLDRSIAEVGYARSGVISADGVILAGNQMHKAAIRAGDGGLEPIIIDSDGTRPVLVRRTDVVSGTPEAMKIAVFDNLANQRNLTWRQDTREVVEECGLSIEEVGFDEAEIVVIERGPVVTASDGGVGESSGGGQSDGGGESAAGQNQPIAPRQQTISVVIEARDEAQAGELYNEMKGRGFNCRVLTI